MGLAKWMVKEGYSAKELTTAIQAWFKFTNPSGYSGDGCYRGYCEKPFRQNGCGGMDPKKLRW